MTHNPQLMRCNLNFHALSLSRLASLLILALALAGTGAAQTPPVGPYGFVLNATFSDPSTQGGVAMLGLMNFDGGGNVNGHYDLELGSGGVNQQASVTGTFTGTYSSNLDGTGTISATLDIGVNATFAMVIENRGHSLELVLTSCVGPICDLSGSVLSGVAEIEFISLVHPVHQGFLNGSYGLQFTKSSPTPQTSISVWTFDGAGNVCISGTTVIPGPNVTSETRCGTYSVNRDGTGNITLPPLQAGKQDETWVFVIAEGRSGLLALQTNRAGDGVNYGTGRIQ